MNRTHTSHINVIDVAKLCSAHAGEEFLSESGWLSEVSEDERASAYRFQEAEYEKLLPLFTAELGLPDFIESSNPALKDRLYFEAMKLSAWKRGEEFAVLAYAQHDRETPVFVSFGYRVPSVSQA